MGNTASVHGQAVTSMILLRQGLSPAGSKCVSIGPGYGKNRGQHDNKKRDLLKPEE